jgi:hypothetical protein
MDQIDLVWNRDKWWAVVNAVMNVRNFLTEDLLASEGVRSMKVVG